MRSNGAAQTQLTNTPETEAAPEFSQDGTHIVFTRDSRIWVMNSDGTDPHPVFAPTTGTVSRDREPAWSPDGTQIVFVREGLFTPTGIIIVNADTTGAHLFRSLGDAEPLAGPAWSPDGTRIAYSYRGVQQRADIYVGNSDGTGHMALTGNLTPPFFPFDLIPDIEPAWSPDGTQIMFVRFVAGANGLWVMGADGSGLTQVNADGADPAWSPAGSQVAYDTAGNVWTANADGSNPVSLAAGTDPSWGPA
jgi:TolB protein